MASISRYDPFYTNRLDPFGEVFKGFFRPVSINNAAGIQLKMDVKEDDKSYTVYAEIPGLNKDDIHVSIDGNQVTISAEVKQEQEVKEGEAVLRSERFFGKVSRSFAVASEIDDATAQAKYDSGVLELVLPKKAATTSKRLTIN